MALSYAEENDGLGPSYGEVEHSWQDALYARLKNIEVKPNCHQPYKMVNGYPTGRPLAPFRCPATTGDIVIFTRDYNINYSAVPYFFEIVISALLFELALIVF